MQQGMNTSKILRLRLSLSFHSKNACITFCLYTGFWWGCQQPEEDRSIWHWYTWFLQWAGSGWICWGHLQILQEHWGEITMWSHSFFILLHCWFKDCWSNHLWSLLICGVVACPGHLPAPQQLHELAGWNQRENESYPYRLDYRGTVQAYSNARDTLLDRLHHRSVLIHGECSKKGATARRHKCHADSKQVWRDMGSTGRLPQNISDVVSMCF